jgi:rfaE bifunctional protein nucleotidyltransferase chain/domain
MKIVMAVGCFDILHIGHVMHLKAAKKRGDYLVVSVTQDAHVNKGKGRPVFTLKQRQAMLKELRFVDRVISHKTPETSIKRWKPHIYVKGADYYDVPERSLVEQYGGKVVFTKTHKYSSTALCSSL